MRNYIALLAAIVFALTFLGADVDARKTVSGKSENAFEKNLPQDYCARFLKGGDREGQLGQANGTQIRTGICSNTPLGEIPKAEKVPSCLILYPEHDQKIQKNTPFTIKVKTINFETGFFSNATTQYNAFPQELNKKGFIQGHQHVSCQFIGKNKNKRNLEMPKASVFTFFKGLNNIATDDILETPVELGFPKPGFYRCCTIMSSFSHQSVVLPVAQRGAENDCVRFNIVNKVNKDM